MKFPVFSLFIREFERRDAFASDCVIHHSVPGFPDISENRLKSARVRAIARATQRASPGGTNHENFSGANLGGAALPKGLWPVLRYSSACIVSEENTTSEIAEGEVTESMCGVP